MDKLHKIRNFRTLNLKSTVTIWILLFVALSVGCVSSQKRATYRRLDEVVIDEVRFDEASLEDILAVLIQTSREPTKDRMPYGIVYMEEDLSEPYKNQDHEDLDPFGFPKSVTAPGEEKASLTLMMRDVTLREALDVVCESVGLSWRINRQGVLLFKEM